MKQKLSPVAAAAIAMAAVAIVVPEVAMASKGMRPADPAAWLDHPEKAFAPVKPDVPRRPALLLETDYYVYGPAVQLAAPEVVLTLADEGYTDPATVYAYWQDRVTGRTLYFNAASGFGTSERDLFGRGGTVARVFAPSLDGFRLWGPNSAFGALPAAITRDIGQYQFVVEVRDAEGRQVISRSNAQYAHVADVVQVSGSIATNQRWTANNAYYLATPVYFEAGATLTIEPGTVVFGSKAGQGTLIFRRGAKIEAEGNAMQPIVFTSELTVGERAAGDWGGLVINGAAPVNVPNPEGEGDSGPYGGNDANDSSGTLRYVRVEFAGIRFSEQNELNGIALQGVGRGTVIEHVQVHHNQDDGLEFFGGTADAKYVLLTDARDDSLDWTFGWQGRLQHLVVIQRGGDHDSGIEADNNSNDNNLQPRSSPTIYNATFVGNRIVGQTSGRGVLVRVGTAGTLRNFIVSDFSGVGFEVNGTASQQQYAAGDLSLENSILFNNGRDTNVGLDASVLLTNPRLANKTALPQPDLAPLPGSPARTATVAEPPNDGFFEAVDYLGGVDPAAPWYWAGWTTFSDN
jgi:hypothetical protein